MNKKALITYYEDGTLEVGSSTIEDVQRLHIVIEDVVRTIFKTSVATIMNKSEATPVSNESARQKTTFSSAATEEVLRSVGGYTAPRY